MTDSKILDENSKAVASAPYEETVVTPTEAKTEEKEQKNDSNETVENKVEETPSTANSDKTESKSDEVEKKEETKVEAEEVVVDDPRNDEMNLAYLNKDFVYQCMAVPTHSKMEWRMVEFIILWARRNNITYEFDDFGNVYLTKGELEEGEFYPCVTSHLDTVQDKHNPYIYAGVPLALKTERGKNNMHKISVDSYDGSPIGIGADDKGGICICLSMFEHLDKLKACFFLDEETGCHGSDHLWKEWFDNVGYVIGYDSPELYRAAWSCSGTKLFSYDFYEKYMKSVCDEWGLVKGCFFSEPYTDVKNIRQKTEIICMNFGNGGYSPHSVNEFIVIEDMDQACGMGIALIDHIGCTQHKLKDSNSYASTKGNWKRNHNGTYERVDVDDTDKLRTLGDNSRSGYYGYSSVNRSTSGSTTTPSTTTTTKKEEELKFETVKYIVNRYEAHISSIKEELLENMKELCETNNIDFNIFEAAISDKFNNEIKF